MAAEVGQDGDHITFCRLCEAFCGLVAEVRDGRVTAIRPDRDNPHSQGHVCVKGVNMHAVTHDPDRVTKPLKRIGTAGSFVEIGWDEALDEIADRLQDIIGRYGSAAVASYIGNPTAYSTNALLGFGAFLSAIGCQKRYGSVSQDNGARMLGNFIVHGSPFPFNIPDLPNCDFLLIIGANPLVSNGWGLWAPRVRHDLDAIARRGHVVVVDPRRSETARAYEHIQIRPEADVWLLLAMMRALVDQDLVESDWLARNTMGWTELRGQVSRLDPQLAAARTGIPYDEMANLARRFATSGRAAVYGGLGLCRGRFGTLGAYLHNAFNALTARYGRPGGTRFGRNPLGSVKPLSGGHGELSTRIGGVPSVAGTLATAMLPADIEEEGEGQVRALLMSAGNPVLTAPGGAVLERALAGLELFVSFDLYQNETNRFATHILPVPTFLERADWPYIGLGKAMRPFLQYTDAVIPPVGDVRDDYWIYSQIARRLDLDASSPLAEKQQAGRRGELSDPTGQLDEVLRRGPYGDRFGARPGGWSRERLREHPHGVMLESGADDIEGWQSHIAYGDGKLRLWHALVAAEFERLMATAADAPPDTRLLTMIGRRDIRSMNSWMHNIDKLVRSPPATLLIHPDDAGPRSIASGDAVTVATADGRIEITAELTEEIAPGTVSYPHGWGHAAGWERANRTVGANANVLARAGVEGIEFVSGMSLIDCLPVTVERTNPS